MTDPGQHHVTREKHVLGGMGLQVLLVALLVFVYTQAARQMRYQRDQFLRLREQVAACRQQVAKTGRPDLAALREQVRRMENRLLTPSNLTDWAASLKSMAEERFKFQEVVVRPGSVEKTVRAELEGGLSYEASLYGVEMEGKASSQEVERLLEALTDPQTQPLSCLQEMTLEALPSSGAKPIRVRLKWLLALRSN